MGHFIRAVESRWAITNTVRPSMRASMPCWTSLNVGDIAKDSLRQALGAVLQDTHLFTGTVMENIRYGRG